MKLLFAFMTMIFVLGFSGSVQSRPKPDQIQILIQEYGRNKGYGRGPDYTSGGPPSGQMASVGSFVCYLTEDLGNTIFWNTLLFFSSMLLSIHQAHKVHYWNDCPTPLYECFYTILNIFHQRSRMCLCDKRVLVVLVWLFKPYPGIIVKIV